MSVYILRERSTKPIKPDDVVIPNTLPRLWYQSQTNISNLNTVSDVENFKKAFATISPTLPQDLRRYTEWLLVLREDRLKAEDAFSEKVWLVSNTRVHTKTNYVVVSRWMVFT